MSANKKRRRLPEEDLAATVADIINSPITRSNLSFLRPLPFQEQGSANPQSSTDIERNAASPEIANGIGALPVGSSPEPDTISSKPLGPHTQALGDISQPSLSTEISVRHPISLNRTLWQAEGLGTIFEPTRVRRIHQAQEALSRVEAKVYDLLWGSNRNNNDFRLVHWSLQRIATEAGINIKTVRELIPRLVDKGFISVEHEADVRRNIATLYRVSSYASVLTHQKQRNRLFIAKTGKGVFYVHPVSAAVRPGLYGEEDVPPPNGYEFISPGLNPEQAGIGVSERLSTGAVGTSEPTLGILLGMSSAKYSGLIESIKDVLGVDPDENLLREMISACHQNAFETIGGPASDEELIYFTTTKARVLARATNIRNHLAVLRKAVPECFLGETFRAYRNASVACRRIAVEEENA